MVKDPRDDADEGYGREEEEDHVSWGTPLNLVQLRAAHAEMREQCQELLEAQGGGTKGREDAVMGLEGEGEYVDEDDEDDEDDGKPLEI